MNLLPGINRETAKYLVQQLTGRTVIDDGRPVILLSADLNFESCEDGIGDRIFYGTHRSRTSDDCAILMIDKSTFPNQDTSTEDILTVSIGGGGGGGVVVLNDVVFNNFADYRSYDMGAQQFTGYLFQLATRWDNIVITSTLPATGWTLVDGVWTHTSGTVPMIHELDSSNAFKQYRVTIKVVGMSTGSINLETNAGSIGDDITTDGTYTFVFTGSHGNSYLEIIPSTDFDGGYVVASLKAEEFIKY